MFTGFSRWGLALAGVLLFVGCSGQAGRGLETAPVVGVVKFTKELPEGQIIFQHSSGEMVTTTFGDDGEYTAEVPVGKNKVTVISNTSSLSDTKPGQVREMEIYTSLIPKRYNEFATSGLEYEVTDGENTFDINLTD
jgi:hypothetical protein